MDVCEYSVKNWISMTEILSKLLNLGKLDPLWNPPFYLLIDGTT